MKDDHKTHPTNNKKRNHNATSNNSNSNSSRKADVKISKALSWLLRHNAPSLGLKLSPDGYVPLESVLSLDHPRFRQDGRPKYTVGDVRRVVRNNDKQRFRLEYRDVLIGESASNNNEGGVVMGDDHAETGVGDEPNKEETINASINNETEDDTSTKVLCIRANQGHSVKGLQANQLLTPLASEELSDPNLTIIHGTTRKAWEDHIQHKGLSRMKRNHIHCATGLPPPAAAAAAAASSTSNNQKRNNKNKNNGTTPISGMRSSCEIYIYINGSKCATDGIPFYKSDNGVILTAGVNEEGVLSAKYFEKVVHAFSGEMLHEEGR